MKIFFATFLAFSIGFIVAWYEKPMPKPIIKTIVKEVKVYDFSQEPRIMEYYAKYQRKTLRSEQDIEREKLDMWKAGYSEAYTNRIRKSF